MCSRGKEITPSILKFTIYPAYYVHYRIITSPLYSSKPEVQTPIPTLSRSPSLSKKANTLVPNQGPGISFVTQKQNKKEHARSQYVSKSQERVTEGVEHYAQLWE